MQGRRFQRWELGVLGLALALRLPRVVLRWDEVTLAYAAYVESAVVALETGEWATLPSAWIGLHPPLYGVGLALSEIFLPIPLIWLLASVMASVGTVWAASRTAGALAGVALAVSPIQLAYAAEVNNYPLAMLSVALVITLSRARLAWLLAAVAFACQTHLLATAAAAGVVLWRAMDIEDRAMRARVLVGSGLCAAPTVGGAIALTFRDTTFIQPEASGLAWLTQAAESLGWVGLVTAVVGVIGLRGAALAAFVPSAMLLGVSLITHAAAPHQMPYLAILMVPLAIGVPRGLAQLVRAPLPRRVAAGAFVAGLGVSGAYAGWESSSAVAALAQAQSERRGVDLALEKAQAGDVVWLVAPALQADDDKTDSSQILWRIPPWEWLPRARRVPFEYRDWRYGQPRVFLGRDVHTSTELHAAVFDHIATHALESGADVWVVLYDHAPAVGLVDRVERVLRPYDRSESRISNASGLGADHVWHVTGVVQ